MAVSIDDNYIMYMEWPSSAEDSIHAYIYGIGIAEELNSKTNQMYKTIEGAKR